MSADPSQKYGNLRLVSGGWVAREPTPEEWLRRQYRSWCARAKVGGVGRYATRAVADIAQSDIRRPESINARIIADALEAGATLEWANEFPPIWAEYVRRKAAALGKLPQQFKPAA